MAVNYRVYQNKRKGNFVGKYYARAAHKEVITLNDIAKTMQANSTVKHSDVMAVLTELSEVLKIELQRGNIVKLDGIGQFKVGLTTVPAETAKEFTAANVKSTHIVFMPETTIDKNTGKLLKVGADAQAMLGRTPGNIIAIRPLREGVISDYEVTERMIKEFLHKVMGFQLFKPRIIICVPSGITEVEERAVIDAGIQAGARRVYLIEEPVAAAIGAGIDITQPEGHMIIDIGGGTSDIAVISLSGVVESSSIKIAGDQFNEAVVKYMRRKHNLLVGERTAEQMKMQIGCVFPPEEEMTMEVKGRSLVTGLPELISVSSAEMLEAFEEPVERIMEEVHLVLEKTPPELVADISNNGIVMTGGGSLVRGFDKLVTARTGIHAMVAENAIQCVAEGTGKSLDSIQDMQDGTMNLSRRKQIN